MRRKQDGKTKKRKQETNIYQEDEKKDNTKTKKKKQENNIKKDVKKETRVRFC